jgi:transposase InsO family protein
VLGQHRSTQRKVPRVPDDAAALRDEIVALARLYGRYGYRRVTVLRRVAGWCANHKRVERIWRREGLKVPPRQPKRGRLWLNDGSRVRLRPEHPNHVWACDFVEGRTPDGRKCRMLCVVNAFTREALAIQVARKLGSVEVIDVLTNLFTARGVPVHIHSDNGPGFVATTVQGWIAGIGARTAYIEPGSPWENGYVEPFNGKFRDELLATEIFNALRRGEGTDRTGTSTSTPCGHTAPSDTGRLRRRWSCRDRPCCPAARSRPAEHRPPPYSTKILPGPLNGDWSVTIKLPLRPHGPIVRQNLQMSDWRYRLSTDR